MISKLKNILYLIIITLLFGCPFFYEKVEYQDWVDDREMITIDFLTFALEDGYYVVSKCNSEAEGHIIIPAEVNGLPVTGIDVYDATPDRDYVINDDPLNAFSNCDKITQITIPSSITSLDTSYTFAHCTSLEYINLPDTLEIITNGTFYGCSSLKTIIIPNSVTTIDIDAFNGCSNLENIIIPDSVTYIGPYAFSNCTALVSVNIPNSISSISEGTFYNCTGIESVIIPDSVNEIRAMSFSGCIELKSMTINTFDAPLINIEPPYTNAPSVNADTDVTEANVFLGMTNCNLYIKEDATGFDVLPWTDTTIFSSITRL